MTKITVEDRDGTVADYVLEADGPLMFALRDDLDLPVEGICGGCATCGSCHVYVAEGYRHKLPARDDFEQAMLDLLDSYDPEASRLSCQLEISAVPDGMRLKLAPEE